MDLPTAMTAESLSFIALTPVEIEHRMWICLAFEDEGAPLSLVEIDEASGFPEEQFEAVIGNMMGGGRCLATGNPTKPTGWFFHDNQLVPLWRPSKKRCELESL